MQDLWTYRFEDLLMFSSETYDVLLQAYAEKFIVIRILFGVLSLLWLWPSMRRVTLAKVFLSLSWAFVGMAFFFLTFQEIFWPAKFIGFLFLLQVPLILWGIGSCDVQPQWRRLLAFLALLLCILPWELVLQPMYFLGLGLGPTATAVGTLGLALFYRSRWPVWMIPSLWTLFSFLLVAKLS